jgi:hypothetical protein
VKDGSKGEKLLTNLACDFDFHVNHRVLLHAANLRLYFPSEGRHDVDFFRPKNPMDSAGFEPAILSPQGMEV